MKKQRHYFANKVLSSQGYGFSSSHVRMWELDYTESSAQKNWCFWSVVLEKTLESPLDCKEIQPVNPKSTYSWTTWMCVENSRVRASRCFQTFSCRVLGVPSLDLRGRGMGQRDLEHLPGANGRSSVKSVLHVSSMCKILFIERALLAFVSSLFEKHSFTI